MLKSCDNNRHKLNNINDFNILWYFFLRTFGDLFANFKGHPLGSRNFNFWFPNKLLGTFS